MNMGEKDNFTILSERIDGLTREYSLIRAFMRGVATGLGSVVGATIVVAGLVWFLGQLQVIPIIGNWLADIVEIVQFNLKY